MDRAELLTVADAFDIQTRGLVIVPDFSVPNGWKNRIETVLVVKPDGQHYETEASLTMAHFILTDPAAPIDKRYRVMILLPGRRKEDVPIGSKIMASQAVLDLLLPKPAS